MEKLKDEKSPGENNLNSELYKYAGDSVHEGLLDFLNNIYRTEWEKCFNNGKKYCHTYIQDRRQTEGGNLRRN